MILFNLIKNDWKLNSTISSIILLFYRIKHSLYMNKHNILLKIVIIIEYIIMIFLNVDVQISYKAELGKNIRLLHKGTGVVISSKAKIGDNCTILHQVTIGINEAKKNQNITIGNNCFLGTGAKIISCNVCDYCKIGANAVVIKDILNPSIVYCLNEVKQIEINSINN